ncbi:MAG: hypothetical protein ACE5G2_00275 [Candidatus Krumholzibacteriia bacterium]
MRGRGVLLAILAICVAMPVATRADTQVIDSHTAEPLGHGEMRWEVGVGPEGSVLSSVRVGVFERFQFGISYGMQDVLGRGDVDINPRPGIQLQALVVDQIGLPAVAVGFDSQGRGRWLRRDLRYERKSPGFYAVATRNLLARALPVLTALSGGVSFSLEGKRESFDLFVGLTQTFGRNFSVLADYDLGLDERGNDADRGYLDFGIQWRFGAGSHIRFLLRDLLGNLDGSGKVARELNFFYLFRL